jgi:hypothetical protein
MEASKNISKNLFWVENIFRNIVIAVMFKRCMENFYRSLHTDSGAIPCL